jgi:hypothetical protein
MREDGGAKPMRLIQLPDGTWVNPERIQKITALHRRTGTNYGQPEYEATVQVQVWLDDSPDPVILRVPSLDEARAERDRIAAMVNEKGEVEERQEDNKS